MPTRNTCRDAVDEYGRQEKARNRAYIALWASEEVKQWIASLPPEKRRVAQTCGLLGPKLDCDGQRVETEDRGIGVPEPAQRPDLDMLTEEEMRALRVYLNSGGEKMRLMKRFAISYVLGRDTLTAYAKALGMSKQAFSYYVNRIVNELNLPALGTMKRKR